MSERHPVVIHTSNDAKKLYGILHTAQQPKTARKSSIIILSPGIKNRVAPHRMYVKMSERFTELGFNVLRFDPEGIGDSEGEIEEHLAADVLASIEFGRFVESSISAIDWMQAEVNSNDFILSGLCGGAITGLLTAAKDKRVSGLLALGIPAVSSAMKRIDPYKYISQGELEGLRDGYLQNVLSLKRWLRFLTLQSDYKMIFQSLFSKKQGSQRKEADSADTIDAAASNLNPLFYEGMFEMLRSSRKICLIFSEMDRLFWEFEEKFHVPYKSEIEKYNHLYEISIVKDANHIFAFSEWEADMLQTATSWLVKHY